MIPPGRHRGHVVEGLALDFLARGAGVAAFELRVGQLFFAIFVADGASSACVSVFDIHVMTSELRDAL